MRASLACVFTALLQLQAAHAFDALDAPALPVKQVSRAFFLDATRHSESIVAVGSHGLIATHDLASADVWEQSPSPVSVTLTAIDLRSDGVGLAVGHDGVIVRTDDHAKSWQRVADGRTLFPAIIESALARRNSIASALDEEESADRKLDLEYDLDDAEFRLETAEQSIEFGPSWPFLDIVINDQLSIAAGAYGMLFSSDDDGLTWQLISDRLDNPEDRHLNAIHHTASGTILIAGEGGLVFRSEDNGESFERYDSDDGLSLFGITGFADYLIAYGFGNTLQLSNDDGLSWESVALPRDLLLIGSAPASSDRARIVGAGGVVIEVAETGLVGFSQPVGSTFLVSGLATETGQVIFIGEAGASAPTSLTTE